MHSTPQTAEKHLPWVRSGLRCLASMLPDGQYQGQLSLTIKSIQQMLIAVYPGLAAAEGPDLLSSDSTHIGRNAYTKEARGHRQSLKDPGDSPAYGGLPAGNAVPNANFAGEPINIPQRQQQHQQQQTQSQSYGQVYTSPNLDFSANNNTNNNPSAFFSSLGQNLMATPLSSTESNPNVNNNNSSSGNTDEMVDFTQADIMDWKDFDFSTMDLEAFMSIDPSIGMNHNSSSSADLSHNHNPAANYMNQNSASSGNQPWGGNDFGVGFGSSR